MPGCSTLTAHAVATLGHDHAAAQREPTWLKLLAVPCCSMVRQRPGSTDASVVMMASMVAMLGWIMPLPLAKPPTRTGMPPIFTCRHGKGG